MPHSRRSVIVFCTNSIIPFLGQKQTDKLAVKAKEISVFNYLDFWG